MEERQYTEEMLQFIQDSPSCFHAVDNLAKMLDRQGFGRLEESQKWDISGGGSFYVLRGDSSLIAFSLPKDKPRGFHIAAAHSDSPCFKIKANPEMAVEEHYLKLNTEKYGGMIPSTWMDRPLSVAGRVMLRKGGKIQPALLNLAEDLLVIPSLAIHMQTDRSKAPEYNPQVDLLPLYGACGKGEEKDVLLGRIARELGVDREDILDQDLFLYVREPGRIIGREGEFVLSPRLDDLQCVYACGKAFSESVPEEYGNVCAVFDNEEVGSSTKQGAGSTFLEDVLVRIAEGLFLSREEYLRMLAESFLISADNAHAVHPNHPEKADPTNRPYLNGGIVLKYHGGQKYTTDGFSGATVRMLCRQAGVPCQTYANRSDIPGGSTLGNILTGHLSVNAADVGLPQLAMHAAVETGGGKDTGYAVEFFKAYFAQ